MDSDFVIQRHCFEDSSEEEDDEVDEPTFTTPNFNKTDLNHGANLIIAVGQTASLFLRSHFIVDLLSSCTITTTSLRVFKDKYFPTPVQHSAGSYTVTEVYTMRQKEGNSGSSSTENFYLCVHEQPLDSRFCNQWCAKVNKSKCTTRKSNEIVIFLLIGRGVGSAQTGADSNIEEVTRVSHISAQGIRLRSYPVPLERFTLQHVDSSSCLC